LDNSKNINRELLEEGPKDDNYMIVMQYAKQGSLRNLLDRKYYDLNWQNKIVIIRSIAYGLREIHEAELVHTNLHSGNILCENLFDFYIADFCLCKPVSQYSSSEKIYGVLPYISPELLRASDRNVQIVYTQSSDIYSFGIIMSEIFNGYPPYYNIPYESDLKIRIIEGYRPEIKCKVPQLLLDLMNRCLDDEPQYRPTAKELVDILEQHRNNVNDENTELHKQVNYINVEAKFKLAQLDYQIQEDAGISKPICIMQEELEKRDREFVHNSESVGQLEEKSDSLEKTVSIMQEELEKKEKEFVNYLEKENQQERINNLEKTISNMQEELEKKEKKLFNYSEIVDQQEKKINNLEKSISNMQAELEKKEKKLVNYSEKENMQEKINDLKKTISNMQVELSENKKQLEEEKTIRKTLNRLHDELIQTCDKSDARIKILCNIEELEKLLKGEQSKEELLRGRIDLLQTDPDEISNELHEILNNIETMTNSKLGTERNLLNEILKFHGYKADNQSKQEHNKIAKIWGNLSGSSKIPKSDKNKINDKLGKFCSLIKLRKEAISQYEDKISNIKHQLAEKKKQEIDVRIKELRLNIEKVEIEKKERKKSLKKLIDKAKMKLKSKDLRHMLDEDFLKNQKNCYNIMNKIFSEYLTNDEIKAICREQEKIYLHIRLEIAKKLQECYDSIKHKEIKNKQRKIAIGGISNILGTFSIKTPGPNINSSQAIKESANAIIDYFEITYQNERGTEFQSYLEDDGNSIYSSFEEVYNSLIKTIKKHKSLSIIPQIIENLSVGSEITNLKSFKLRYNDTIFNINNDWEQRYFEPNEMKIKIDSLKKILETLSKELIAEESFKSNIENTLYQED
ncbi:17982_t:CDS:2, partial [Cetraspora pellucida]